MAANRPGDATRELEEALDFLMGWEEMSGVAFAMISQRIERILNATGKTARDLTLGELKREFDWVRETMAANHDRFVGEG